MLKKWGKMARIRSAEETGFLCCVIFSKKCRRGRYLCDFLLTNREVCDKIFWVSIVAKRRNENENKCIADNVDCFVACSCFVRFGGVCVWKYAMGGIDSQSADVFLSMNAPQRGTTVTYCNNTDVHQWYLVPYIDPAYGSNALIDASNGIFITAKDKGSDHRRGRRSNARHGARRA